ncbi:hypothetical protein [Novosphingopyxis baekryungensis]|uniref:hypothetical protein n=1 Tax=Novosphingopyxis baekryungensis TaxID=279369 RepID=UPI000406BC2C|nr:hypothetical protein [Novosphingopyxis baekryungensis]
MRNLPIFAAAILSTMLPGAVSAQTDAAAPAAPDEDAQVTMDRAGVIFGMFSQAVRSEDIAAEEKNALVGCMYENSLKTISAETGRILGVNPELDATKPGVIYAVAATVCGARQNGKAAAAEQSAPATPTPESR